MFSVPRCREAPVSLVRLVPRFATVGVVATAACVYDARLPSGPAEPAAAALAPQFATVARGASSANVRHIVSFNGSVPADFAAQVAALGGKVLWVSPGSGLAAVSGLQGSAATTLAGAKGIQGVDGDALIALDVPRLATDATADGSGVASNAAPAAAVRYPRQWNMRAVQADVAWAHGFRGSSSVSVFMLDSGIDPHHADTEGRVDPTRSVDLLGTFDAQAVVNGDTVIVPFTEADTVQKYFRGHEVYTDLFFHGTHTAATVSSNAVRAAGITSMTTLVAVKVCGYINDCPFSSILNGVIYAANGGADVVNMSLGGAFTKAGHRRDLRRQRDQCQRQRRSQRSVDKYRCACLLHELWALRHQRRRAWRQQLVRCGAPGAGRQGRLRVGGVQPDEPAHRMLLVAELHRRRPGDEHGSPTRRGHRGVARVDRRPEPRRDQGEDRAVGR